MKTVNISLVGGQTMPVYVGVRATQPSLLVLVHSDKTREEAEEIKANARVETILSEFPPVDFDSILSRSRALLDGFTDSQVFVNISSGTKPWSIAFYRLSLDRDNVTVIYVDQNSVYYDLTHDTKSDLSLKLGIEDILRFHHQKVSACQKLSEYTAQDRAELIHVRKFRFKKIRDFNELVTSPSDGSWSNQVNTAKKGSYRLPSGSFVSFDREGESVTIGLMKNGMMIRNDFRSPHIMDIVFFAGWFEYEVAMLLAQWPAAGEIWMSARFPYMVGKDKNEIDVLVSLGEKLLFVECKTQIADNTNIDKFASAANHYGGKGAMKLFVTDARMSDLAKEKCRDHGILSFSFEEAMPPEERARIGLNNYNSIWGRMAKLLQTYLDKELKTINK